MELSAHLNEPLHGIIARYATEHNESPIKLARRLMPGVKSDAIAFVLPGHLGLVLEQLPPTFAPSPEELAEHHTFFPAIAPFLDSADAADLLRRMTTGAKVRQFDICRSRTTSEGGGTIRYCPLCAAHDRASEFGVARFRMAHQLIGIVACAEHACRLIATTCSFSTHRVFYDAETAIPRELPIAEPVSGPDLQLAKAASNLFSSRCPRPGQKQIVALLRSRIQQLGFIRDEEGRAATRRLCTRLVDFFGKDWIHARCGLTLHSRISRMMGAQIRVLPAFYYFLVALGLGIPLSDMLAAASKFSVGVRTGGKKQPYRWTPSLSVIESHRATILNQLTKKPTMSRHELTLVVPSSVSVLARFDLVWLASNISNGRRSKSNNEAKWRALDSEKDLLVRAAANKFRSTPGRPKWITIDALRRATVGSKWRDKKSRANLPLFHNALSLEVDNPETYAKRVAAWLGVQIEGRECQRPKTLESFLRMANLCHLAQSYSAVRSIAESKFKECAGEQPTTTDARSEIVAA